MQFYSLPKFNFGQNTEIWTPMLTHNLAQAQDLQKERHQWSNHIHQFPAKSHVIGKHDAFALAMLQAQLCHPLLWIVLSEINFLQW